MRSKLSLIVIIGLLVPAIARADALSLGQIAQELKQDAAVPLAPSVGNQLAKNLLAAQAAAPYTQFEPDSLQLSIDAVLRAIGLYAYPGGPAMIRQRNYSACLHGYYSCDQSKLTDSQRAENQQAVYQRNYNACLHGHYGCNQSKLTDAGRTQVQQAAKQRNFSSCLHGYSSCDRSRLTDSQKESLAKSTRSAPAEPASPPHYYTNSAGERVQSPTYYPKAPTGATAQCRDGTYSFSRNHRGTCSHHGGVNKWLD
jgi:hypothetical protein